MYCSKVQLFKTSIAASTIKKKQCLDLLFSVTLTALVILHLYICTRIVLFWYWITLRTHQNEDFHSIVPFTIWETLKLIVGDRRACKCSVASRFFVERKQNATFCPGRRFVEEAWRKYESRQLWLESKGNPINPTSSHIESATPPEVTPRKSKHRWMVECRFL